jgi:protein SCO1
MMKLRIPDQRINWRSSSILISVMLFLLGCNGSKKTDTNESATKEKQTLLLPVFGESKIGANGDTLYHTVGNFSFVNQFGDTITENTTANKIYVADFFFATCESICPKMSDQLKRVQNKFLNDSNFLILSHTVNPSNDNVQVLNEYGGKYGAIINKWHLMTGDKKSIYDLAKTSYLVNAIEDDGSEQGFLHSETFLLVDAARRLRGIYDGTDSLDVDRLMKDIVILKSERINNEKR